MVAPDKVANVLITRSAALRAAQHGMTHTAAAKAAQEVAGIVKSIAARRGHSVSIAVVAKGDGVRLTIRGRHAGAYKTLVHDQLKQRVPSVQADVRAQITRK